MRTAIQQELVGYAARAMARGFSEAAKEEDPFADGPFVSQTTCLHPTDPQPDCGMACQECEPAAAPQAQIGAALKVAQDCRDNATGEVTAEIHIRAVMILEAAAKGILPAFCKPALDKALADYTPVCIAPTGEDFYAFGDDPVQPLSEAFENYEAVTDGQPFICPECGPLQHHEVRQDERDEVCVHVCCHCHAICRENYEPDPDDERGAALDIEAAEGGHDEN